MMRNGYVMKEDAGRGWRRVVASPRPLDVVEKETVRAMVEAGQLAIAVGGGGIPVFRQGNHLKGASAVVDKDLASAKLAELIDADLLIILTAVERVALHFGKPEQRWLDRLSVEEARRYMGEGHFAKGSMLPKVQAAVDFAASRPGRSTLITLLAKAKDGIEGRTGTRIG
jgi:carbamate kinase